LGCPVWRVRNAVTLCQDSWQKKNNVYIFIPGNRLLESATQKLSEEEEPRRRRRRRSSAKKIVGRA